MLPRRRAAAAYYHHNFSASPAAAAAAPLLPPPPDPAARAPLRPCARQLGGGTGAAPRPKPLHVSSGSLNSSQPFQPEVQPKKMERSSAEQHAPPPRVTCYSEVSSAMPRALIKTVGKKTADDAAGLQQQLCCLCSDVCDVTKDDIVTTVRNELAMRLRSKKRDRSAGQRRCELLSSQHNRLFCNESSARRITLICRNVPSSRHAEKRALTVPASTKRC